ncbi:LLM class flavin-dependent oxidoreductase [Protaetiibacter larvae]|uniref:LLM class flavin-dependent oxidoreductase n=1 Tax=Protaetiibacter larvae TaxID=2592654 RepID=A0A5C1YB24_9MICO|nr:LLM class flavin-dependent oxidoreductase [Protaetiibacter larvae]
MSLGLPGSLPLHTIREAAVAAESAGLHALWLNDTPGGDSLAGLAAAAGVTTGLQLATGVIPLDRLTASEIAGRVIELGLPRERLTLGVGSGAARHPVPLVAAGIVELEALLNVRVVLGALGPRMRRLGAERAHGLLLSWLTPETAAVARAEATAAAIEQGRRTVPRVVLYARTITEPAARPALETESARYESYPSYAANFARLGHGALAATIGAEPGSLADGITAYAGAVDELVLRAITGDDSAAAIRRFVDAVEELGAFLGGVDL